MSSEVVTNPKNGKNYKYPSEFVNRLLTLVQTHKHKDVAMLMGCTPRVVSYYVRRARMQKEGIPHRERLIDAELWACTDIARWLYRNGPADLAAIRKALVYPIVTIKACVRHRPDWFRVRRNKLRISEKYKLFVQQSNQ